MTPELVGILGIIILFILLASGIYIGIAMALVGFLGFSYLSSLSTGLSLLGMIPYGTGSFYTFSVIPLFVLVMGGIYLGVFTPIEAAGVGASGALVISFARKRMNFSVILKCLQDTLRTTAMIFLILIGAEIFTLFLGVSKLPMLLADVVGALPLNRYVVLGIILMLFVILGCVMDGIAMIVLIIPIIFPVVQALNFDPIWFGVLMVIVLEMGLITPPVGLNVFIIKGVAKDVPLRVIFTGVIPFLVASVVAIILIMIFPEIALFIPTQMW